MAIVYTHTKKDNGNVFYIGIGKSEKRAYVSNGKQRNPHWHRIALKYGITVNITHRDICWEEACKIEQYLIDFWRNYLGKKAITNITDGGEGVFGLVMNENTRHKMRDKKLGTKQSAETRLKHSLSMQRLVNETDFRDKIRQARLGQKGSDEMRKKVSEARKGAGNGRSKKVIDNVSGKIYDTLKDAALDIAMPVGTLQHQLTGYCKNTTNLSYLK
jgi:hypothetical protein